MLPQVDPATRPFRSPVFAAFYARRLNELRGRVAHLCTQAWDVNSAWLLHRDLDSLIGLCTRAEAEFDTSALRELADAVSQALAQPHVPDEETRHHVLERFSLIDTHADAPELGQAAVRHSENERVEVPPPGFWRRWTGDAPSPTRSASEAASNDEDGDDALGLADIDIDAMLASGTVRSSTQIVQERIAPHLTQVEAPESAGIEPPDDFISADDTIELSDDYNWDLRARTGTQPAVPQDSSLDAFWEATDGLGSAATREPDLDLAPQPPVATPALEPSPPAVSAESTQTAPAPSEAAPGAIRDSAPPAVPAAIASVPASPPAAATAGQVEPAIAPAAADIRAAAAAPSSARHEVPSIPASRPAPPATAPAPTPAAALEPELVSGAGKRIYHLTESGELAVELDQRLEQLGYELELLENAEELKEVLGALTPNIVLVDAEFQDELESIGAVLRTARMRASNPIRLLVLCRTDTMAARLAARRAGADALLFDPQTSNEVIARIETLLHDSADARFRILVVEDDPAQGLFAESILRNAGMEAEVVQDGLKIMEAMERFQPDLVLMDLYMPDCDGTELTALIRERDEFLHTPIVFLSGESDEDKHYEALSAGGDDFLSKPIRPKYLIATVTNRVRRARAMRQRAAQVARPEPFDSGTGLHFRAAMLERLEQALMQPDVTQRDGGLLFIGIENVPALRQRMGLTTVEELLEDAAQFIVGQLGQGTMACRYGDACFLVFDAEADPLQLQANADQLRDAIGFHAFDTPKEPVTLEVAIGAANLRHPFADAAAVLNYAEHAARSTASAMAATAGASITPATGRGEATAGEAQIRDELLPLIADAMTLGLLDVDYQPIVALQGGEKAQYQTLLRLHHPDGTTYTAGQLLPLLREQQRLAEFDRWVLNHALDVASSRLAIARPVTLFVNQSIETLRAAGYAQWLTDLVSGASQIGESLVIEINADEVGLELEAIHALCTGLLSHGVRFCLSRYRGTPDQDGMLHVLPVDLVKVAPELVTQLGGSQARADFSALVERMHDRAIGVIAPRVEDTRTAAVLWMSGIDYIQGNLVQLAGSSLDFDFNAAVL